MADKFADAKQAYDEINEMYKRNKLDAQEALRRGNDGEYRRLTHEGTELEKQLNAARRTYREQVIAKIDGTGGKEPEKQSVGNSSSDTSNTAGSTTGNTTSTTNTADSGSTQPSPTPDAMAGHYTKDPVQATSQPAAKPDKPAKSDKPDLGKMAKDTVNKFGKGFYEALANADSATFKRDVNAKLRGQMTGNIPDVRAETSQQAARLYENDAANRYMEAQREQQEGERNPFHEAGKIAESQQHAQNKQQINNSSFAGGTAQARLRTTVAPDVQGQKDFGARARQLASQYREKGDMRTRDANEEYGESKEWRVHSRDYNKDLDESARLSMGEGKNTEGSDAKPAENAAASQPAAEAQPAAEQPAEQTAVEASGGLQNVVNAVLGSNVRRVKCENGAGAAYRVQPDGSYVRDPKNDVGQVPANPPPYTAEMEQAVQQLTKSEKYGRRPGETDEQYKSRVNGEMGRGGNLGTQAFAQNYGNTVQSDSRMKNVHDDISTVMSDLRMKFIKEDYDRYGELLPEDVKFILSRMGKKYSHDGRDYDIDDEDEWGDDNDSVLDGYAENIRNYVYNYKPEAQAIDSSIDPNQEHIGPMAQDIEKVNPACIIETPEGVKTVDTGRLAMMNAGAIGDLARRLDELEALIKNG